MVALRDARLRGVPPNAAGGRDRTGRPIHGPAVEPRAGAARPIMSPSDAATSCRPCC